MDYCEKGPVKEICLSVDFHFSVGGFCSSMCGCRTCSLNLVLSKNKVIG